MIVPALLSFLPRDYLTGLRQLSWTNVAQFIYRLTKCPELCFGIFISATPDSETAKVETWATAKRVENGSERRLVLIAHAIGTKTVNDSIQDEDMNIPDDIQIGRASCRERV